MADIGTLGGANNVGNGIKTSTRFYPHRASRSRTSARSAETPATATGSTMAALLSVRRKRPMVPRHGFYWSAATGMKDVNSLVISNPTGLEIISVNAINDFGSIAGVGRNPNGFLHAFGALPVAGPIASAPTRNSYQ